MPAMPPRRNALYDASFYEQPLAFRSSMLPIGTYQNDDGSESAGWAWPQMMLDAKEAAEIPGRYLSGDPSQAVTPQEAQRTAINAAGLMMGGGLVAPSRVAKATTAVRETPSIGRRFVTSDFEANGRQYSAKVALDRDGTAFIDYIGAVDRGFDDAGVYNYAADQNTLSRADLRRWRDEFIEQYPETKTFAGNRASGAKDGQTQTVPALFSSGSKGGAGVGMGIVEGGGKGGRSAPVEADWDGMFGGYTARAPDGKAAAYADVLRRPDGFEISNITSFPEYRGQGYASSIVDNLIAEGSPVRVSPMTADGQGFFNSNYRFREDGTLYSSGSPLGSGIGMTTENDPYQDLLMRYGIY